MTLMQQQKQDHPKAHNIGEEHDGKVLADMNKHRHNGHGLMVPRQFMDLGLAGATAETDEASLSSSEGRSGQERSRSPMNNVEASTGGSNIGREDSPEKGSQGWGPNKVPRLNHNTPKNVDQATEATMRKARVSVRARSEAPMVKKLK